ncbi:MAG: hypothetical protein MJZ20_06895 [Bacteroidaceae bacterium]|nr:hypothetical protein [Bacteroidaceae bacterium]
MKTKEEILAALDKDAGCCYLAKVDLINRVNNAITGVDFTGHERSGIVSCKYEVFYEEKYDHFQEYLVVTYFGGAIAARTCNINSHSAILRELSNMLDGGYYDEVKDYQKCAAENVKVF